jgi:hypothetical protein
MLLLLVRGLQKMGSLRMQFPLFNIFTSDFSTLTDVQLALFADDSALFSAHAEADVLIDRLQSALNTGKRYYSTQTHETSQTFN